MTTQDTRAFSPAVEDYLKAIYNLQTQEEVVSTTAVSLEMKMTPAAASKMFKYLAEIKLIEYIPYYGVRLTPAGKKVALEVIRHHRLLELYLHQALGYGWDEVDAEAEKLEHHISEEFEARIDEMLNFPQFDPHGHPIPTREGEVPPLRGTSLAEAEPGDVLVVLRVGDSDPEALRFLSKLGVRLQAVVSVKDKQPFNGPLTLCIEEREYPLGRDLANLIFVEPYTPTNL